MADEDNPLINAGSKSGILLKLAQLQSQLYDLTFKCLGDTIDTINAGGDVQNVESCKRLKDTLDSAYTFSKILWSVNNTMKELAKTLLGEETAEAGISISPVTSPLLPPTPPNPEEQPPAEETTETAEKRTRRRRK
jgi:hypothetical protein